MADSGRINMGTRWMCTIEAPIHHNVKEAIVKMDENGTILVLRKFRNTTRLARVRPASAAVRTKC
jgi:NAD(P)H-dependent flavin oxidoreductase YrpB (nitropropane dioxygenase family)